MIIPIWQHLYQSSHRLAQSIGLERNEPATHTGTLDPLAQGVLVVLTGEDRFLKGKLSDWSKEYSFSILWGIETDSGDQLGLIQDVQIVHPTVSEILALCQKIPKSYAQTVPAFSARRWRGRSAFDAAKEKEVIPRKTREVTIQNLKVVDSELVSLSSITTQQLSSVLQVEGNFRQSEIRQHWHQNLAQVSKNSAFLLTHHKVETSSGTYIRQLVQDMAEYVKIPATTWAITRTRNGPYTKESIFLT